MVSLVVLLTVSVSAAAVGAAGPNAVTNLENSDPSAFEALERRSAAEPNTVVDSQTYDLAGEMSGESGHSLERRYSNPAAPLLKGATKLSSNNCFQLRDLLFSALFLSLDSRP
jgi:hypothetical protein